MDQVMKERMEEIAELRSTIQFLSKAIMDAGYAIKEDPKKAEAILQAALSDANHRYF